MIGETLKRMESRLASWEGRSRGYEYEEIKPHVQVIRHVRKKLQRQRRALVEWGENGACRWGVNVFFHSFFLVDAEIHSGRFVHRGPMYGAMHARNARSGARSLVLKMNWVATRHLLSFGSPGTYSGACDVLLFKCGEPKILPNKDIWFFHDTGCVVIHSGSKERLRFEGDCSAPRIYTYF